MIQARVAAALVLALQPSRAFGTSTRNRQAV
jgi:hypothetical protein